VGGGEPALVAGVGAGVVGPAWSRAGDRLAYSSIETDVNVYLVELSDESSEPSSPPLRVAPSTRTETYSRISPDGERVAFLSDRAGGEAQLWVCDRDGSNLVQLTSFGERRAGSPSWSPDGRWIAFDALDEEELWQVFVLSADGGPPRKITSGPARHSRPSFSPDSAWVYFSKLQDDVRTFWKAPLAGGEPLPVSDEPIWTSRPSPDGRWIYYWDSADARAKRIPAEGGNAEALPEEWGLHDDDFVLDDLGRLYSSRRDADSRERTVIRRLDPTTGETADVFTIEGRLSSEGPFSVSADGRRLTYHLDDVAEADLMLLEGFR
jgi:Tol biopolymer transport system component